MSQSIVDLHGPDDLLNNAKYLLDSNDSRVMRAVVLESITALEVFVNTKMLEFLKTQKEPEFISWLKNRTEYNFNHRLEVLTPLALGIKMLVLKQSDLWRRYMEARNIRNDVTHKGKVVNFNEAELVYETIYDWLTCLSSSIGLELALIEFKRFVEQNHIPLTSEIEAINLINSYFKDLPVSRPITYLEYSGSTKFDYILKFGMRTVILETKFPTNISLNGDISELISRFSTYLENFRIDKVVIIIFLGESYLKSFKKLKNLRMGKYSWL